MHRLPWPETSSPRTIVPESVLGPSRKAVTVPSTHRKRGRDSHGAADGAVVTAAMEDAAALGRDEPSSNGNAPGQGSVGHSVSSADGVEASGAGEHRDAMRRRGREKCPPRMDVEGACRRERCDCPCFCGLRDMHSSQTAARTVAGTSGSTSSATIARLGTTSADLSRVEQLVGGAAMVRGCALGVRFVTRATKLSPGLSVSGALDLLDAATAARDNHIEGGGRGTGRAGGGLVSLFFRTNEGSIGGLMEHDDRETAAAMTSFCGGPLVALPRRFEVAAALHRLPGVKFLPASG